MDDPMTQAQAGQAGGSQMPPPSQTTSPPSPIPPPPSQTTSPQMPQQSSPPPQSPGQPMQSAAGGQAAGAFSDDAAQGWPPTTGQAQGGTQAGPPPPPSKPANFQLGALLPASLKVKVPPHTLQFDEQYFLHLLAGSISLTKDEKIRIVESIPKLKQSQIDELVKIFEEERKKFAELGEEHVPQLDKLARQHYEDWVDIEMHQQQSSKADQDAAQAEEIRKQLGI